MWHEIITIIGNSPGVPITLKKHIRIRANFIFENLTITALDLRGLNLPCHF